MQFNVTKLQTDTLFEILSIFHELLHFKLSSCQIAPPSLKLQRVIRSNILQSHPLLSVVFFPSKQLPLRRFQKSQSLGLLCFVFNEASASKKPSELLPIKIPAPANHIFSLLYNLLHCYKDNAPAFPLNRHLPGYYEYNSFFGK